MRWITCALFVLICGTFAQANSDSLEIVALFKQMDSTALENPAKSKVFAQEALERSQANGDPNLRAYAMLGMAHAEANLGYTYQAINWDRQVLNVVGISALNEHRALINLGFLHMRYLDDDVQAIDYFLQAESLHSRKSISDEAKAAIFNNLGACFFKVGDKARAQQYFQQILDLDLGRQYEAAAWYNLAHIAQGSDSLALAKAYALKALELSDHGVAPNYNRLHIHTMLAEMARHRDWEEAYRHVDSALAVSNRAESELLTNWARLTQAKVLVADGKCLEAQPILENCYAFYTSGQHPEDMSDCVETLLQVYQCLNLSDKQLELYAEMQSMKQAEEKQVLEREHAVIQDFLDYRENLNQAEASAETLREEADIAWQWVIAVGLCAGILIVAMVFILRLVKKTNQLRAETQQLNEELESKVEERTREIQDKNERLKNYISWNSHRLRVPIANMKGILSLLSAELPKPEEWAELSAGLSETVDRLDETVQEFNREMAQE